MIKLALLAGGFLMCVVNMSPQAGPRVFLHVAVGAEVLDALEVVHLHMLHQVALGVLASTLYTLPAAVHAPQVGRDEVR